MIEQPKENKQQNHTQPLSLNQMLIPDFFKLISSFSNTYISLRHGEAGSNVSGLLAGSLKSDKPEFGLTPEGKAGVLFSVHELLDNTETISLLNENNTIIYSSPLCRAKQTADLAQTIIESRLRKPVNVSSTEALADRHYGDFEQTEESNWIFLREADLNDPFESFANAEPVADIFRRQARLILELEERHKGKIIVLIGHADPIQILEALFGKTFEKHYSEIPLCANAEARILHQV